MIGYIEEAHQESDRKTLEHSKYAEAPTQNTWLIVLRCNLDDAIIGWHTDPREAEVDFKTLVENPLDRSNRCRAWEAIGNLSEERLLELVRLSQRRGYPETLMMTVERGHVLDITTSNPEE